MPELPTYMQQVTPAGEIPYHVRATANDFGGQIGQGIEQVGAATGQVAQDMADVDNARADAFAINAASQAHLSGQTMLTQMQTDPNFTTKYGADGGQFAQSFSTAFDDYSNKLVASAPTTQSQNFLSKQLVGVRNTLESQAIQFQAQTGAKYTTDSVKQSIDADAKTAMMNPDQLPGILSRTMTNIDQVPHIDEDARLQLKDYARNNVAYGAGIGAVQKNPEAVLASLEPEALASFKPTPRVEKVLNSNLAVTLPAPTGGDIVKPYAADQVANIVQLARAPSPYDALFQKASTMTGVPVSELKLHAAAESNMKADTPDSSQGAQGLMQLSKETQAAFGVTDPKDPWQSIFGGAQLLAQLQVKAGGDSLKLDKMYYGGQSGANWGANTAQYAENLAAVRQTMTGQGTATNFQQVLDSVLNADKNAPVKSASAPPWFNSLDWKQQYEIVQRAKQGVQANEVRDAQMAELKDKQQKAAQVKTMNGWMDKAIDGTLSVADIRNDESVNYEGKKYMLDALHSEAVGENKTDPKVFWDTMNRIHAPDGDPNKITDDNQIVALGGKGLSFENIKQLRGELAGKGTEDGQLNSELRKNYLDKVHQTMVKGNWMMGFDQASQEKFYNFQQAFFQQYNANLKAGASPVDMLTNPKSKFYIGDMDKQPAFNSDPFADMRKEAAAAQPVAPTPAAPIPADDAVVPPAEKRVVGKTYPVGGKNYIWQKDGTWLPAKQ